MFCSNCGKEISDDSKVCGFCGIPVGSTQTKTSYHQTQTVYGEPETAYSGKTDNGQMNAGNQNSQGSAYQGAFQNGYQQNTGYGTPQNMDGGATGMGIASMILGIVALLISCCVSKWWLTVIVAACGIVLGVLSINKNSGGKGMAIAGIVCSCLAVLMGLVILALGAALFSFIFSMF